LPSRLTGLLTVAAAPLGGGSSRESLRVWRRDRNDHPSPNAGQCESAMAGALGVRLGGRNVYFGRSEVRPFLGDGPRPSAGHLRRAAKISGAVGAAAAVLGATLAWVRRR
jgi:adenosylcobinamide-phosphate synthase